MSVEDPPPKSSSAPSASSRPEASVSRTPRSQPSPSRSESRPERIPSVRSLSEPTVSVPRCLTNRPPSTSSAIRASPVHRSSTPSAPRSTSPIQAASTVPTTSDPSVKSKTAPEKKKKKHKHSSKHDKAVLEGLLTSPPSVPISSTPVQVEQQVEAGDHPRSKTPPDRGAQEDDVILLEKPLTPSGRTRSASYESGSVHSVRSRRSRSTRRSSYRSPPRSHRSRSRESRRRDEPAPRYCSRESSYYSDRHYRGASLSPSLRVGSDVGYDLSRMPSDRSSSRPHARYSVSPVSESPEREIGPSDEASPTDDFRAYNELLQRMAKALDFEVTSSESKFTDKILQHIYSGSTPSIAFPLIEGFADLWKKLQSRPASATATNRKVESLYRTKDDAHPFLAVHPPPSSLVTEEMQARPRQGSMSAPADKVSRKIDALGRKLYTSATFGIKVANYAAMMAAYQLFLWKKVASFLPKIPDDQRTLLRVIQEEAVRLSRHQINVGRSMADTAARSLLSSVVLRRYAWLRTTALPVETRNRVEDLPFEGNTLFSEKTDEFLSKKRTDRLTARSYGVLHQPSQQSSRPYYRSFQRGEIEGETYFPRSSPSPSSEPSPDEALGTTEEASTTDDFHAYNDLHMAKALEIDVTCTEPRSKDKILQHIFSGSTSNVAFPIIEGFAEMLTNMNLKLVSTPPANKKFESMYRMWDEL
ncbi:lamina-associated polypeptide 2-like [Eublepharis macularius]|uniref:Lamina-associated polypeptide 2-like n=1 Tax=Eublepharis macularius TaxID=481883 RepID=A0AA97JW26_EUBMA|nr:lamina-associated polypeptide 2-like [Eublepharis macularius]